MLFGRIWHSLSDVFNFTTKPCVLPTLGSSTACLVLVSGQLRLHIFLKKNLYWYKTSVDIGGFEVTLLVAFHWGSLAQFPLFYLVYLHCEEYRFSPGWIESWLLWLKSAEGSPTQRPFQCGNISLLHGNISALNWRSSSQSKPMIKIKIFRSSLVTTQDKTAQPGVLNTFLQILCSARLLPISKRI